VPSATSVSATFPVFAPASRIAAPTRTGRASSNVTIALTGMVIEPGDLVIGDDDGPPLRSLWGNRAIYNGCETKKERVKTRQHACGKLASKAWVDEALAKRGAKDFDEPQSNR